MNDMVERGARDYSALIERLEKAEGPDRELDRDLWEALTGECTHRNTHYVELKNDERELECSDCGVDTYGSDKWTGLTRSLDRAVAMVERVRPGWSWGVTAPDNPEDDPALQRQHFSARLRKSVVIVRAHSRTPTLALLLATLSSLRAAIQSGEDK